MLNNYVGLTGKYIEVRCDQCEEQDVKNYKERSQHPIGGIF